MKYSDFEQILSHERLERYVAACGGNTKKAMTLYRLNRRLSQEVFTLISCFEVALRNSINVQLVHSLGNDWLRDCVLPGGRFQVVTEINKTCRIVNDTYQKLAHEGKYSHSHLLSKMEFGIWKYMFSNPQYRATGRVLLNIFPNRPRSSATVQYNNTYIFNELDKINMLRNRIAHHEPICFMINSDSISTYHVFQQYQRIQTLFSWMNIDARALLYGLDHVQGVCDEINNIKFAQ
ncbi:MAG: Abi family protein [Bacteroidaceae bacterium]|nr:Abi family protein [Bacteroidaceae bacterium]